MSDGQLALIYRPMKAYTSVMVGLFLPSAEAAQLNAAVSASGLIATPIPDMHLTLIILGDAGALGDYRATVAQVVQNFAAGRTGVDGVIGGVGRFDFAAPGQSAVYASFDSPALAELQDDLTDALQAQGLASGSVHGFFPHITLAYIANDADTPDLRLTAMPIMFDSLTLAWGDERTDYPFGSVMRSAPPSLDFEELDGAPLEVPSTAIKTSAQNFNRFEGYAVLWGDETRKDLTDEYFTASTDLGLELHAAPDLPAVKIPTLYHHALDKVMKTALVGTIDSATPDEIGLWVEGEYNKRLKYLDQIKTLVKKGALSFSSGSIPHHVKRSSGGRIERWPIYEVSMTPTPAEPRGTDIRPANKHFVQPEAIKSAYRVLQLPTIGDLEKPDGDTEGEQENARAAHASAQKAAVKTQFITKEGKKMDITAETLDQLIEQRLRAKTEAEAAAAKAKADEDARIKAEVDKQVAAFKATAQTERRTLPAPEAPVAAKTTAPQAQVIGDRRFVGMSSEDMSFMYQGFTAYAKAARMQLAYSSRREDDLDPGMRLALRYMKEFEGDSDRKIEREIAAKAIREVARKQTPDTMLDQLPYKSLDAVSANAIDPSFVEARQKDIEAAIKANELDSAGQSGYGADWVNQLWSNQIWYRVRMNNVVASNMQVIDMPTNPFNLPIETTDPTVYYVAEGTDATQLVYGSGNTTTLSKGGSAKKVLTAVKLGTRIAWSNELNEDSIISIVPIYRHQAQRALLNFIDDTVFNGDTATGANTNINLIDGTPTTGTSYLALDGMRKYALITNTGQLVDFGNASTAGGAPTMALFRQMRSKLSRHYAVDINNLAYILGFEAYMKAVSMPEFANWLALGAAGSNVTGLLPGGDPNQVGDTPRPVGYIDGVPAFVSAQVGLAKGGAIGSNGGEISGTPANNVTSTAALFHRSRWYLGFRRRLQVDLMQMPPLSDSFMLWGYVRLAIANFDATSLALGYNIAI